MIFYYFLNFLIEIESQWYGNGEIQCYSCSDCPEPFIYIYAQTTLTPTDVGRCMILNSFFCINKI